MKLIKWRIYRVSSDRDIIFEAYVQAKSAQEAIDTMLDERHELRCYRYFLFASETNIHVIQKGG